MAASKLCKPNPYWTECFSFNARKVPLENWDLLSWVSLVLSNIRYVRIFAMVKTEATFICRNVSMGLCECETGEWQVLQDGMWNAVKSPYGSKYVDVKLADKKSTAFSLSIQDGKVFFLK